MERGYRDYKIYIYWVNIWFLIFIFIEFIYIVIYFLKIIKKDFLKNLLGMGDGGGGVDVGNYVLGILK